MKDEQIKIGKRAISERHISRHALDGRAKTIRLEMTIRAFGFQNNTSTCIADEYLEPESPE